MEHAGHPDDRCRACGTTVVELAARFCSSCGAARVRPSDDPNIGTVVADRYRLVQLLGEGASGRVYEGRQSVGRSERRVAVKVLRVQHADNPRLVKRVEREVEIACSLTHPSTIRVFDFGETVDGRPFIVMEFVDGTPLATVLESGPLPLHRAASIFSQICGALAEAHEHGIVHRDLKPENIMVMRVGGQSDLVKLLDFGIAKDVSPERSPKTAITERGMIVGTPEYMSPEQFAGADLGPATDIYALGVIAYEVLTGHLPFEADEPIEWATRHALDAPAAFDATPAGAAVPDAARKAVLHALEKEIVDRPATVAAFYQELFAALPGAAPALGHWSLPPPHRPAQSAAPPPRAGSTQPSEAPPFATSTLPKTLDDVPAVAAPATRTTLDMEPPSATRRGALWLLLVGLALAALAAALFKDTLFDGSRRTPPPLPPPPTSSAEPVDLR